MVSQNDPTDRTPTPAPKRRPKCPICGDPVNPEAAVGPFCSKRCQTIDLGKWLDGKYLVSRPIEEADLDEGE